MAAMIPFAACVD